MKRRSSQRLNLAPTLWHPPRDLEAKAGVQRDRGPDPAHHDVLAGLLRPLDQRLEEQPRDRRGYWMRRPYPSGF